MSERSPEETFKRHWRRVDIFVDGHQIGVIASCAWGFALRLENIGVFWAAPDKHPARGGASQRGFKRQRDAIEYVKGELPAILAAAKPERLRELGITR